MDPKKIQLRFDLTKRKGCSIKSFVIRETNGDDEESAAIQQKAKGGVSTVFEELIRLSIVYVDDAKVEQPLDDLDGWNSRTRSFVIKAFKSINGVEDAEEADFLASGTPLPG